MEFHHPPNFPWILAAIPVISESPHGLPRSIVVLLICFWDFVGLGFVRFPWSIINQLSHWHWRDVTVRCIFPFSNRQIAYCRERRWGWRRWRRMTLLFYKCPWSWWKCRGRTWKVWNHDWNEVLRITDHPNSVFNEMWFFDHWSIHKNIRLKSQSFPSDNTAGV